jgi:hypothetical protein
VLNHRWIPPLGKFPAGDGGKIRSHNKQFPNGVGRGLPFAQLAISDSKGEVRAPESGHVDLVREAQRCAVVALSIGIKKSRKPIPSGMMRIEVSGALIQGTATLPIAGERDEQAQVTGSESVGGIECHGLLRGGAEGPQVSLKELRRSHCMKSEMIRWRSLDGTQRGRVRTSDRISPEKPAGYSSSLTYLFSAT